MGSMSLYNRVVLTELFDKPAEFSWRSTGMARDLDVTGSVEAVATFKVGDQEFAVWFTERLMPSRRYVTVGKTQTQSITLVDFAAVNESDRGIEVDQQVTGSMGRKSLKVFSSVGAVILAYVRKHSRTFVLGLIAANSESTRVKLYKKLAPKLAKKLGWKFTTALKQTDSTIQVVSQGEVMRRKIKGWSRSGVVTA